VSALAEQHETWAGVRERLWKPARKDLRYVRPLPPPEPEVAPEPVVVHYAPFNFLTPPSALAIIKLVALKHGVGASDIRGPHRSRPVAAARHEAVWLVHTHCQHLSTTQVGRLFGGRDHSTALNSIRLYGAKRGKANAH
jgi:hypothetical protein